jgi:hypothetical protein
MAPPVPLTDRRCDLCGIELRTAGSCVLIPVITRWDLSGAELHRVTETWCGGCAHATHATPPNPR